jgi:hypothetical protein
MSGNLLANSNPDPEVDDQPTYKSRYEERLERREERRRRRAGRHGRWWLWGLILIALGVIFLLESLGVNLSYLSRWWALFILIPAVGALGAAWNEYTNNDHRFTRVVRGSLSIGLGLVFVTAILFFNLPGAIFWPILLILAGLGILVSVLLPD